MTNHHLKRYLQNHRFLDSSGGRAEGFKSENWGSNLTLQKYFFLIFLRIS